MQTERPWDIIVIEAVEDGATVHYTTPTVWNSASTQEAAYKAAREHVGELAEEMEGNFDPSEVSIEDVEDGYAVLWPDEDGIVIEQYRAVISQRQKAAKELE